MALRIPSPVALTKPEAYLAYKAGILSRGELKDKLLNPINNYEGWLAKWCELLETYPTNEDGTPQCLTDEEGLLAYLCGVTNRYPATNSRPDDARVSAYIRYLVSARYGRPDHPLNREEFYLSLIKTQFIPSGDPSSDIVIDGTTKAPFVDVKVYGDSYQQTYSGKNLLPTSWAQDFVTAVDAPTLASLKTQDGKSCLSFQPSAGYNSYPTKNFTLGVSFKENTQYTASFDEYSTASTRHVAFYYTDGTYSTYTATPADTWTRVTMTSLEGKTVAYIAPFYTSGTTYVDINTFQIEEGTTATDYEPYVGGTPAPNPSYPQPISVVTGDNVVKVVGKNLAWTGWAQDFVTRVNNTSRAKLETFDGKNCVWWQDNTGYGDYDNKYIFKTNFQENTQYTLSCDLYPAKNFSLIRFQYTDGTLSNGPTDLTPNQWNHITLTSTAGKTLEHIQVQYNAGNVYCDIDTFQLERGSQATSYQAYTAQDFEVNLGKNLIPLTTQDFTLNSVRYKVVDGDLTLDGTSTGETSNQSAEFKTNFNFWLDAGTYTLSYGGGTTGMSMRIRNYDDNTTISNNVHQTNLSETFTLNARTHVYLGFWVYQASFSNKALNIQLEQGSTATSFAPYFTPLKLAKIPGTDYRDKILYDTATSKWYVEKQVGKVVLDGSETWAYYSSYGGFRYRNDDFNVSSNNPSEDLICSHFTVATVRGTSPTAPVIKSYTLNTDSTYIFLCDGTSDVDAFKQWLSTHPTTVYYALATPTTTEITNQSLIDQLNALKQGGAEEGTTYIRVSATGPNLPAKLYVEAPKYD